MVKHNENNFDKVLASAGFESGGANIAPRWTTMSLNYTGRVEQKDVFVVQLTAVS